MKHNQFYREARLNCSLLRQIEDICIGINVFKRVFNVWHMLKNIVAAFRGMHVSPTKHSYARLPRKCDYRTDTRTDRQTPDKVIPMCCYALQATQNEQFVGKQRKVELKSVGNFVAKTVLVKSANQFSLEELCRTQYSLKYFLKPYPQSDCLEKP